VKRSLLAVRLLKSLLITVSGFVALLGIYWLWLIWRYDTPYHRIMRGDTEDRVVTLLGKPFEVSAPHDVLKETWADKESFGIAQSEIVKQYRYRLPVITGDEYIIGFDSDGHAVVKSHLTSP
jgi:hypothetical protein